MRLATNPGHRDVSQRMDREATYVPLGSPPVAVAIVIIRSNFRFMANFIEARR